MKFEFSRLKVVQKENLSQEGKVQITGPNLLTAGYLIEFTQVLTCTFRASCYSTRLSWAHTPVINWAVCLEQ